MILIAAIATNGVIGHANGIPWRFSEELRHFRKLTLGHTLIMGRRTYASIGRPLPGRRTVIVSRTLGEAEGFDVCPDLRSAIRQAESYGTEVFVAGGASIYRQALPLADALYLSFVDVECEGDAFFPDFDEDEWEVTRRESHRAFTFVVYERKQEAT